MNWLDKAIGALVPGAGLRRARQRQALAVLTRAYEGARQSRRTEGWIAGGTGANAEIGTALHRLRDRSRDLVRNNPYASGTLRVSYDGKSIEYGNAEDLLARIRRLEGDIAEVAGRPKPRRSFAAFTKG